MPIFIRKNGEPRWLCAARIAGISILGLIGLGALALLFGFAVMWLWNWLLPDLFGFKTIAFWQGVGIVLLARMIFGSFSHKPVKSYHRHHPCRNDNRKKWSDRWEYYEGYWNEEGEKAFEAYVERKKGQQEP